MSGARSCSLLGGVLAALLGALVLLAAADTARAEMRPGTAEIKRVTGRVEVLRKGQTQWFPAAVGAKLVEGDEIRSFAGGSAEMELPDTSNLLLAENSRLGVTKLVVDAQRQIRLGIFRLAIGKVRATIAQAAITLVRARQTNFAISTPTGVAAARGTDYAVFTDGRSIPDGGSMVVAVFRGAAIFANNTTGTPVVVGVGGVSTQRGTAPPSAPVSITTLSRGTQATLRTTTANPETRDAPALLAPRTPGPTTDQVVKNYVKASSEVAGGEAGAMVGGIAAADPGLASAAVTGAIEGGASAGAVIAAAATAAPGPPSLAVTAGAEPTLTPAPPTSLGIETKTTPTSP